MLCIEYITLGWLFFFSSPSQIRSHCFCFLSENDKHLVIIGTVYRPQLENSCPVFSCCFSLTPFRLKCRAYWCCGWSWTPLLCLIRRVLLPTPGLMEAPAVLLWHGSMHRICPWKHAACQSTLGRSCRRTRSRQSPGSDRPPGIRPQFEKSPSESRLLYLTLHSPVFLLV